MQKKEAEKWYTVHFQPMLIIKQLTDANKEIGTQYFFCNKIGEEK